MGLAALARTPWSDGSRSWPRPLVCGCPCATHQTGLSVCRGSSGRSAAISVRGTPPSTASTPSWTSTCGGSRYSRVAGGAAGLLGAIGLVKEPTGLSAAASRLGQTIGARSRDRLAADSYWRGAPASLAEAFGEGCDGLMLGRPSVVVIDRWEYASDFDVFACETLVPRLPSSVKVIVAGRKDLAISNPRWLSGRIGLHPGVHVDEFVPEDAREFLCLAGLEEAGRQNEMLAVVGGFPLLLVLLRTLARGPGGWDAVGPLQPRDNNQLARLLLERILDAPGGEELGPALELGCIPDHLTPTLVGVVLEVEESEAARIYDLLDDSELTEPHPSGIRIHDRVRELLLDRLKFNRPDAFRAVSARVVDHHRSQVRRP